jgi:hypothetical protein
MALMEILLHNHTVIVIKALNFDKAVGQFWAKATEFLQFLSCSTICDLLWQQEAEVAYREKGKKVF